MNIIDLKQRWRSPHARPLWQRDFAPHTCLRFSEGWAGRRINIVVSALCLAAVLLTGLPDVRLSAQSEPVARQSLDPPMTGDDPGRPRSCTRRCRDICKDFTQKGNRQARRRRLDQQDGPALQESSLSKMLPGVEPWRLMRLSREIAWRGMSRALAIPPLERALKTSSRLVSADDTARLKDTLQTTRAKSQNIALEKPAPGEITNSIGMRLVAIRPSAFVMGSTPAEIRSRYGRVECSGSDASARKPDAQCTNIPTLFHGQI